MSSLEHGTIVVGADGSDDSVRAVRWAAEQARSEGRTLTVVSVGERARQPRSTGGGGAAEGDDAAAERWALASAEVIAREAAKLVNECEPAAVVQIEPRVGDPRDVLVELSSAAAMIVLGSRGRGAVRSMLLGSVSAGVSSAAACPVVVCRPPAHDVGHGIVVAADGTPESRPVLEFAFRQASLRGRPLTVLHCFWDVVLAVAGLRRAGPTTEAGESGDAELIALRESLVRSVEELQVDYPDVSVSLRLQHGLVGEVLTPRRHPWELAVVGRHPMTSHERILAGSIATTVVERAHGTVAVVPEPGLPSEELDGLRGSR